MKESQKTGRLRLRHLMEKTETAEEEMVEERVRFTRLAKNDAAPKVFSSFNLFPTPPALAKRLVEVADLHNGQSILEPSAGTGNLLRAIADRFPDDHTRRIQVTAVEIDGPLWHHLSNSEFATFTNARLADFLQWEATEKFDRVVMNPPFKMGRDIKHIKRAISLLAPGGRLVSLCANGPRQREHLKPLATEWIELPANSFASEGTRVDTAIFVYSL